MAGYLDIPKFKDYRNKVKRHRSKKFPVLSLKGKTTIAIHHSLTKQGLGGSNAEGYARFHVDSHGWPSIGYSYVIEPDGTIKWCNDIELRTYHVGNHNNYAVGIVLTGDFRYEDPTDEQKESLRNLVNALQKKYPHLKHVKGHNEFSGYEWKPCPVFDYKAVLNEKGSTKKAESLPNSYTIQEGDTLWSIAKGLDITVDDIEKANPGIEPTKLQIGQKINLGKAKVKPAPKPKVKSKTVTKNKANLTVDGKWSNSTTRALQKALGTPVDGVLSSQSRNNVTEALYGGVTWGRKGSLVIKALQRKLGVKPVDGLLGPATVRALQRYLGTVVDGKLSRPSLVVKELQRRLNKGTL